MLGQAGEGLIPLKVYAVLPAVGVAESGSEAEVRIKRGSGQRFARWAELVGQTEWVVEAQGITDG